MELLSNTTFIMIAILAGTAMLTLIALLKLYKKCPPEQLMIVFGKTGGKSGTQSSKIIHGGGAFIIPILQGVNYLSLKPIQVNCDLKGALSSQNIRVNVPAVVTVGISKRPEVMQAAAERLLGLTVSEVSKLVEDIVFGQLRIIIAELSIEELNKDRDSFQEKIKTKVSPELEKLGVDIINVNIVDIKDEANYLTNLGKQATAEAENNANKNIAEQDKLGKIAISEHTKEQNVSIANNQKDEAISISKAKQERESQVASNEATEAINIQLSNAERDSKNSELLAERDIRMANAGRDAAVASNKAKSEIAKSNAELQVIEQESIGKAGAAQEIANALIDRTREESTIEVENARAEVARAKLKAEQIVPATIAKEKLVIEADAYKTNVTVKAEADAEAIRLKAEAEAEAIRLKALAEAEGKEKSLLAEANGFAAMVAAAESNPGVAIQYKMVEQWEKIAGAQVEAFKHIKLGNITVFDGTGNSTGEFLNGIIKNVAPALGVMEQLPIKETFNKIIGKGQKDSNETVVDKASEFPPIDKTPKPTKK